MEDPNRPSWRAIGRYFLTIFRQRFAAHVRTSLALSLLLKTLTASAIVLMVLSVLGIVMGKALVGNAIGGVICACAGYLLMKLSKAVSVARQNAQL